MRHRHLLILQKAVTVAFLVTAAAFFACSPVEAGGTCVAKVTLLKNSEFGDELISGIKGARSRIICSYYLFKTAPGKETSRIVDELIKAKKRGVDVAVILEKSGNQADRLNKENIHTAALLAEGGVKVFFDSERVVSHQKVTVVDDRYVYLGSHNLTPSSLRHNNELSVRIDSPALAAEIKSYFEQL